MLGYNEVVYCLLKASFIIALSITSEVVNTSQVTHVHVETFYPVPMA